MIRRDEYAHLDDYELAVEHVLACADLARFEGHELHAYGFAPVPVIGLELLLWERGGKIYTTYCALVEAGAYETIPEDKEDR